MICNISDQIFKDLTDVGVKGRVVKTTESLVKKQQTTDSKINKKTSCDY